MKLQLSLEFLLYLGLASTAMLAAFTIIKNGSIQISDYISRYSAYEFIQSINTALVTGNQMPIQILIPSGMCNSTIVDGEILTPYGKYDLEGNIEINTSELCPSGNASIQVIQGYNNTYLEVKR
jgi:hypothetical protein